MTDQPDRDKLESISDDTWNQLRGPVIDRLHLLTKAYRAGMTVARSDEERELLAEIERLLGRPP